MVFTDEFADLGRDFGALKAHLTNESAKSSDKTCLGGLTCHEQLSEGPDVTQSASASGRQADSRQSWLEGRLNVPLHVVPYRVEGCISGRHVVGATLASRRGSKVDCKGLDGIAHERRSQLDVAARAGGPRPDVAACLRLCA